MKMQGYWLLSGLSDGELEAALIELVAQGAWTNAQVVAHIAEVEVRLLHARRNKSLFDYCQEDLGLSHNEAFYRINAARIARLYPVVFEMLEQRRLHLTAIALIRYYISPENHRELLEAVAGKTKQQILLLLATRAPRPDAINRIRRLPVPLMALPAGPTGTLEPLSAEGYRLELHVTGILKGKLDLAVDLMSHANPARDLAVVVERGLDLLIARLQQRRFGQTANPRPRKVAPLTEGGTEPGPVQAKATERPMRRRTHIPHELRRQLVERDGLGCTHVDENGQRCGARAFLQIHHDHAWANGGPDTIENLRFVCAAHNHLIAEDELGAARIRAAIAKARTRRAS